MTLTVKTGPERELTSAFSGRSCWPVQHRSEHFGAFVDGAWSELGRIDDLLEGWLPHSYYPADDGGVGVLYFSNDDQVEAWFVDTEGRYLAGRIDHLPEWCMHSVETLTSGVIRDRCKIAVSCRDAIEFDDVLKEQDFIIRQSKLGSGLFIDHSSPDACFPFFYEALSFDGIRIDADSHGATIVKAVCPQSGRLFDITHTLCLDDYRFLIPIPEAEDVYLCQTFHDAVLVAVFDATTGTLYPGKKLADAWMSLHYFGDIARLLAEHMDGYRAQIADYRRSATTRLAAIFRAPPHMGHQLWNELPGLEKLLTSAPHPVTPPMAVVIHSAPGSEVYGPIDMLFPELAGSVLRLGAEWRSAIYEQNLCALRLTTDFVPSSLRTRIAVLAGQSSEVIEDRDMIARARTAAAPIIILGLRVENRTVDNLGEFLVDLIGIIAGRWPNAVIVVDGHNRKSGDSDAVFESGLFCKLDPYEVELELTELVGNACRASGLSLVNLVGSVMERSVFWSANANCFVAPWGAGLAKYRWVGNLSGVILSSRWNIEHRSDFDIYITPQYMEAPSPVAVIDVAEVTDVIDTSSLLMPNPPDQPQESSMNFRVSADHVAELLGRYLPAGRPGAN